MKKIVKTPVLVEKIVERVTEERSEIVDDKTSVWDGLLGKEICIFGAVYIYSGTLSGVNGDTVMLTNTSIVYETGAFSDKKWKDAQKMPANEVMIQKAMVESFFEVVR